MDDPLFVRGFECFAPFAARSAMRRQSEPDRARYGRRASAPRPVPSRGPSHRQHLPARKSRRYSGWFSAASERSLALKARQSIAVLCEGFGQHLDRDIALKSPSSGPIHFPHAADSDLDGDFIGAESRPRGQGHLRGADYRWRVGPSGMCESVRIKSSQAFAGARSRPTSVKRIRVRSRQHAISTSLSVPPSAYPNRRMTRPAKLRRRNSHEATC